MYLLSLLGVNVKGFTPPMVMTVRFLVDAVLPFLVLIPISLLTKRGDPQRLDRFYARLKTPVATTPEADAFAVAESDAQPARFDHTKIFPKSDWEFTKWNRTDALGFLACCGMVGIVLLFFKALMLIGK